MFPQVVSGISEVLLACTNCISPYDGSWERELFSVHVSQDSLCYIWSIPLWKWLFKEISNVFWAAITIIHRHAAFIALMHVTRVLEDVNQKSILLGCTQPLESSASSLVNWVCSVYYWHENNRPLSSVCISLLASPLSWAGRDDPSSEGCFCSFMV